MINRVPGRFGHILKNILLFAIVFAWIFLYLSSFHPRIHKKVFEKLNFNVSAGESSEESEEDFYSYDLNIFGDDGDEEESGKVSTGIDPKYKKYIEELGLENPGENGEGVVLPINISDKVKQKVQEGYDRHGFNAFVSNLISVNRKVPDSRNEICRQRTYFDLPKCSIVILVYNEDWSTLMRTIHSILNRSPTELIEEILLADDASDQDDMLDCLDEFAEQHSKIRIIRSREHVGIIKNRISGAVNAKGPVLVFLDSHVEVMYGWLEPLLARFVYHNDVLTTVFSLRVNGDSMKFDTFNIDKPQHFGGVTWKLEFYGMLIDYYESDNSLPAWNPKPVPIIYGSTFAIRKDYLQKLGMFDPDFDVWGGDDIELSLRVWMCGGRVEFVPCSITAHLSKSLKYPTSTEKGGFRYNTDRIAEIWLDDFKKYYYRSVGDTKDRNYGDIKKRLELKEKLGCKNFKWFYENILKNETIPEELRDKN